MQGCLVCRVIRRVEPVTLIYEDNDTVAFLFQFPLTEGHTIVCPKKHFADIFDAESRSLAKVMVVVQAVSRKMLNELGIEGVNLVNNSGQAAGQDVFHFHMHIIPRREGDQLNLKEWWLSKARPASEGELSSLATKLKIADRELQRK
jgi:histidine triad (HIT) family protein